MNKDFRNQISLRRKRGEYKYLRFESNQDLWLALTQIQTSHPNAETTAFFSPRDPSLLVECDFHADAIGEESSWTALETEGEMPFGSVPGLIASISQSLVGQGIGVCVISSFEKDLFLIRTSKIETACGILTQAGWRVKT